MKTEQNDKLSKVQALLVQAREALAAVQWSTSVVLNKSPLEHDIVCLDFYVNNAIGRCATINRTVGKLK